MSFVKLLCNKAGIVAIVLGSVSAEAAELNQASAFENIPASETEDIKVTVETGIALQDKRAKNYAFQKGKLLRGVHAKSHGCVKAKFTVNADLDEKYRVGLFATAGQSYKTIIRFSNASVLNEADLKGGENGSRGMAIKIMNVKGDMLSQDNGRSNQDFLMINTPEFAFANVRDYRRLNEVLALPEMKDGVDVSKGDKADAFFLPLKIAQLSQPQAGETEAQATQRKQQLDGLKKLMGQIPALKDFTPTDLQGTIAAFKVVQKIKLETVINPVQASYFGAAPFLFGTDSAMKFSVVPALCNDDRNYLRTALTKTVSKRAQKVCFDFKIQTRNKADVAQLNIEDATKTWPDEEKNYVTVARLDILAPQNPKKPVSQARCESLAFSPWHGLAAHQPLGGINRLRQTVYNASAAHRGAGTKKRVKK